ncbi:MAG: HigA family addiction module antidote protein [Nitrospinae bacterium]|nr:HigA family addiction module antidote protein [Nitrospinota bacterium]
MDMKRKPTHPGEILREDFLKPLNLTQVELAKALGTAFRTINEIVNERRNLSPEMAVKLARYFGTSEEVWLNLQNQHDIYRVKTRNRKMLVSIKPLRTAHAAR